MPYHGALAGNGLKNYRTLYMIANRVDIPVYSEHAYQACRDKMNPLLQKNKKVKSKFC
jgi:hypothetical protein